MSEGHEVPDMEMIIIKRGHAHEEHPHGGAWKVAFADFMTAMMAFFLVLWIVNSTNKETRSSVARYFNPIRISDTTAARKGLKDPKEADFDASASSADEKMKPKSSGLKEEGQAGQTGGVGGQGSNEELSDQHGTDKGLLDPITARDPFIVLDEIAGRATGATAASGRAVSATADLLYDGPVQFRDPFAPPSPVLPPEAMPALKQAGKPAAPPSAAREVKTNPPAALPGGGVEKLEQESASVERQAQADRKETGDRVKDTKQGATQQAMAEAVALRDAIGRVLREMGLAQGPKLDVRAVDEGILISLTDDLNFGMFAIGSAEPQPRVVAAMQRIGELLAVEAGSFIISGHTDARPFKSRAYDNWRLSSARAQMAAYMLMRGKLEEKRIERIEGHADRALRNAADPFAAENRRIEILLRRNK